MKNLEVNFKTPLEAGAFFLFFFLLVSFAISAQSISLETCQEKAKANYPLIQQYSLIEQTAEYNISNANKGYLPQLSLSGRATYQSHVTKLPITLPGMNIPELSKDQYQAVLEASQVLWDGGMISSQKKMTKVSAEVEKKKLEVDLFALNDRVNQLYFGILLLDEQMKQTKILEDELRINFKRIETFKLNGVASQVDVDAIQVEQLNIAQRVVELKSTIESYLTMLSVLSALQISEPSQLVKPTALVPVVNDGANFRPEIALFDAQSQLFESQKNLLNAGNLPKVALFAQGGYGKPGLNMLTNEFSAFYIGGVRLAWNFAGLYSQKNNVNKLEVSKKNVSLQKETFLFNTTLKIKQQKAEIEKFQSVIKNDDEIIRLRRNIKQAASAKLENGTYTVTDLLREMNAESQAKQVKALHEIQLLLTIYQLKNTVNQ